MTREQLSSIKVNFIIGHGRSGTTLLTLLLNNTAGCVATPEIKHFLYFYRKYRNVTRVTADLISDYRNYFQLLQDARRNPIFVDSGGFYFDQVLKEGDPITYSEVSKLVYLSLTEGRDPHSIQVIVDKNPFYTFNTDKILDVFPDARFVVMVRDYRAYVLSNLQSQQPFNAVRSVYYYARAWNAHVNAAMQLIQNHPSSVMVVRYEDLVNEKQREVQKVIEFFGLEYKEEVFDFYKKIMERQKSIPQNSGDMERTLKKIRDLSSPVNPQRVYAWKTSLSPQQIRKIEYVSGKKGSRFGYFPTQEISFTQKLVYTIEAIPGTLRVAVFFLLNSVKIHHYLNVVRKARYNHKKRGRIAGK